MKANRIRCKDTQRAGENADNCFLFFLCELIRNDSCDLKDDLNDLINISDSDKKLIKLIMNNPRQSQKALGDQLKLSEATIKRMLNKMKKIGIIKREGSRRNGKWIIVK